MKNLILIFMIISGSVFGQFTEKSKGYYTLNLFSVEENGVAKQVNNQKYNSEAEGFSITWSHDLNQVYFVLENNSNNNIRINWNNISLIDQFGENNKIFHSGIKYIDREKEQAETMVYKNSKLSDLIIPINNVYYRSGKYGGWIERPIIKAKQKGFSSYFNYDKEIDGKEIRIAMPLIINEKQKDFIYTFKIEFQEKK